MTNEQNKIVSNINFLLMRHQKSLYGLCGKNYRLECRVVIDADGARLDRFGIDDDDQINDDEHFVFLSTYSANYDVLKDTKQLVENIKTIIGDLKTYFKDHEPLDIIVKISQSGKCETVRLLESGNYY